MNRKLARQIFVACPVVDAPRERIKGSYQMRMSLLYFFFYWALALSAYKQSRDQHDTTTRREDHEEKTILSC